MPWHKTVPTVAPFPIATHVNKPLIWLATSVCGVETNSPMSIGVWQRQQQRFDAPPIVRHVIAAMAEAVATAAWLPVALLALSLPLW